MAETTTAETVTRDPLAVLEEIRRRGYRNGAHGAECGRLSDAAAEDIPRLLAGSDALLKLATEYEQKSADLWAEVHEQIGFESVAPELMAVNASTYSAAAKAIRVLIAAALSGEETPDGN